MRTIIGVMGGAVVGDEALEHAHRIGQLIAENGWALLNGGRNAGVMAASAAGAREAGGLVIGILPSDSRTGVAPGVDVAVVTGMGDARNAINVLSSDVVIALQGGPGTVSEVALALKAGRSVVMLGFPLGVPFAPFYERGQLVDAANADDAVDAVKRFLAGQERL